MMQMSDPFLAIVLDPIRSHIAGKVDIGAFRTCPEEAHPGFDGGDNIIPEEKIKDFGLYFKQYYKLETSYYMNEKDSGLIEVSHLI
jgi:COP9 signalosome complex subunit 5